MYHRFKHILYNLDNAYLYKHNNAAFHRLPIGGVYCIQSSLQKGAQQPPMFGLCLLWPNSWIDQDATWYGGRPRQRPHCVRWGPSSRGPHGKEHSSPPHFPVHFVLARSPISATAKLLFYIIAMMDVLQFSTARRWHKLKRAGSHAPASQQIT